MKHDYQNAGLKLDLLLQDMKKQIDVLHAPEWAYQLYLIEHTLRHALAMMEKLQDPSEGMLETMKQIIWNNTWSKDNCRFHITRLLEQAEKEIKDV